MLSLAAATAVGRWQEHGELADADDAEVVPPEGADTEIGAPGVEET